MWALSLFIWKVIKFIRRWAILKLGSSKLGISTSRLERSNSQPRLLTLTSGNYHHAYDWWLVCEESQLISSDWLSIVAQKIVVHLLFPSLSTCAVYCILNCWTVKPTSLKKRLESYVSFSPGKQGGKVHFCADKREELTDTLSCI
jgi:hypothetical protein